MLPLFWDVVLVDEPDDLDVVGVTTFVDGPVRFGLASFEASGPSLVRRSGIDPVLTDLAVLGDLLRAAGDRL